MSPRLGWLETKEALRNPQTGEHIILDARRAVTWSYSPLLKKAVNGTGKFPSKAFGVSENF